MTTKMESLLLNSIALTEIAKNEAMKKDFNEVLKNSWSTETVEKLLTMKAEDFIKTNANEVMTTWSTGFGAEWVQTTVIANTIIDRIRNTETLLSRVNITRMSWPVVIKPVAGGRTRMVATSENTDQPQNKTLTAAQIKKTATAKITLTAFSLAITVYISDDLLQDSVINLAEYAMREIQESYENSLHEILINWDVATGANANINIIDGNTSALPSGNNTELLKADWVRKLAFTKTATVDAGWNLVLSSIRTARQKMGMKGANPADLVLVPDLDTYFKILNLSQAETIEKFWNSATVVNWQISAIDWIKIINREEMLKALASGKQSATLASNVKGAMALVHLPSVEMWIYKDLTVETSRFAEELTTWITWSTRVALTLNDVQNNVSATSPCALIINI